MSARSKARKQALDLLYESDIRRVDPTSLAHGREEIRPFALDIVALVIEHRTTIDDLIGKYAQGWDLDRMPAVDRNILRIAIAEILWEPELAEAIAISEALDLAKELSTEESAQFIHGLLARVVPLRGTLP